MKLKLFHVIGIVAIFYGLVSVFLQIYDTYSTFENVNNHLIKLSDNEFIPNLRSIFKKSNDENIETNNFIRSKNENEDDIEIDHNGNQIIKQVDYSFDEAILREHNKYRLPYEQGLAVFDMFDDPIDDYMRLSGVALNAEKIEKLRLCSKHLSIYFSEKVLGPKLTESWSCDKDISCQQCRNTGRINLYNRLIKIWNGESSTIKLQQLLDDITPRIDKSIEKLGSKVIVVLPISKNNIHLFFNWLCSVDKIGLDPTSSTIIIPLDNETYETLKKYNFNLLPMDIWNFSLSDEETNDFIVKNTLPVLLINELLNRNYAVLFQNPEVIWIHNPIPYLKFAAIRRDIIAMDSPGWTDASGKIVLIYN